MSKIIWKDIDSTTIKGLLISELPPITKPKMRVEETQIDGVDGSIIEELGYETYDKSIEIGLHGNFNIDEVIKYFTGEGQVVFSNEPDKYYNARIIDQIDYERLLRFREATVKFRVQPFKYEYQEEEGILSSGSTEGETITLDDKKISQLKIEGKSEQETTKGNQLVDFSSANISYSDYTFEDDILTVISLSGGTYNSINYDITDIIKNNPSKVLSFDFENLDITNFNSSVGSVVQLRTSTSEGMIYHTFLNKNSEKVTYTIPSDTSDITKSLLVIYTNNNSTYVDSTVIITKPMLRFGTDELEYEKYTGGNASPSPNYQSEIKNKGKYNEETGKYEYEVESIGEQLLDLSTYVSLSVDGITATINEKTGFVILNGTATANAFINFRLNKELSKGTVISWGNGNVEINSNVSTRFGSSYNGSVTNILKCESINKITTNYTLSNDFDTFTIRIQSGTSLNNYTLQPMINLGSNLKDWEPYKYSKIQFALNESLRSLPNGVKDIAYIKNNKLYVDRKIGSAFLDSSEEWWYNSTNKFVYTKINNIINSTTDNSRNSICVMSDNFHGVSLNDYKINDNCCFPWNDGNYICIKSTEVITDAENAKKWLSEHPTQVDYELAESYTEEYGDLTMLELFEGENNISNSADTNMIIDYVDNKLIINNKGNHIAKPIFEIEGAGTIELSVNDNKFFSYTFPDGESTVVIDSDKQDAYLGTVLKNRNMTGEFPTLESGENIITWTGLVKDIKVVKKSRWL